MCGVFVNGVINGLVWIIDQHVCLQYEFETLLLPSVDVGRNMWPYSVLTPTESENECGVSMLHFRTNLKPFRSEMSCAPWLHSESMF